MVKSPNVRITGPLLGHVDNLWRELLACGYTPLSARNLVNLAAHLSRWLESHRFSLEDLHAKRIEAFLRARRRDGYTRFLTPRALKPILHYLEQAGVALPTPEATRASPLDRLLHEYADYLIHERALTASVVWRYCDSARRLLNSRFVHDPIRLSDLAAQDVITFVLNYSRRYSIGTSKQLVCALRSFLRYLYLQGEVVVNLSSMVPAVAGWRLVGLPKGLDEAEVQRVLRTCDRRRRQGRRSYALLLLMLRLGLRCCEVATLELDDIDWIRGELTVRGKGREDKLPLPEDVGEALVCYLRADRFRPRVDRRVFPRTYAPHGPLSSAAVRAIVARHLRQAGVHPPHPHRLRHTAATQMLRNGASLDSIAQVLRHRSQDTTAIYAKVDRQALRLVAQPWPGGAS